MTFRTLTLAAAAAFVPALAAAAPLYTATGIVEEDTVGGFFDFFDEDGDAVDVAVSGSGDPAQRFDTFIVSDASGTLLESTTVLSALGTASPGVDTIVFGGLTGSAVGDLASVTVEVSFGDLGGTPDPDFPEFVIYDPVDVTVSAAVIPLPAGLPLLALGLGALGIMRRRA